jgi:hypothetical protein
LDGAKGLYVAFPQPWDLVGVPNALHRHCASWQAELLLIGTWDERALSSTCTDYGLVPRAFEGLQGQAILRTRLTGFGQHKRQALRLFTAALDFSGRCERTPRFFLHVVDELKEALLEQARGVEYARHERQERIRQWLASTEQFSIEAALCLGLAQAGLPIDAPLETSHLRPDDVRAIQAHIIHSATHGRTLRKVS